jgi:hypothetical protein
MVIALSKSDKHRQLQRIVYEQRQGSYIYRARRASMVPREASEEKSKPLAFFNHATHSAQ